MSLLPHSLSLAYGEAALPLIHVDAYRLLEGGKSCALYLDDLWILIHHRESAVTVIEWGGEESARLSEERLGVVYRSRQRSS
jgi:tRNA threonylcarbamoyladenosine biosynthesis protein TsaE